MLIEGLKIDQKLLCRLQNGIWSEDFDVGYILEYGSNKKKASQSRL